MTLKEYLDKNGIKYSFFAKEIGCDNATMTRYLKHDSVPGRRKREFIEKKTNGAVTTSGKDWFKYRAPEETAEEWHKRNNVK